VIRMFDQFLSKAGELVRRGEPFAIAEVVRHVKPISGKAGDKAIILSDGTIWGWIGGGCAQPTVVREGLEALRDGRPRLVRISPTSSEKESSGQEGMVAYNMTCHSGGTLDIYIEPVLPKPHILILGRSPVGMALAKLARTINYTVTVAASHADRESYPDVDQILTYQNLSGMEIRPQTFIVVSTQGEDDEDALEKALRTRASYIAFVASRAKAAKVIQSLSARGIEKARLEQVRAPAGLDIQARSQEEIAVSILAEIIQLGRSQTMDQKAQANPPDQKKSRDPICGMTVDITRAKHSSEFEGRTFYFCGSGCKQTFDSQPEKHAVAKISTRES
jgi:xanthine dehydrogenase accessory factor